MSDGHCVARVVDYSKRPKEVLALAKKWLDHCADEYGGNRKLCVGMDIDETVLYTHKNDTHVTHHPLGFALFELCKSREIDVHFVTARVGDNSSRTFVRRQLSLLGFDGYKSLYMVNARHQDDATPSVFKGKCRKTIVRESGKTLALNVGDQMTDMFASFDQQGVAEQVAQLVGPSTYYFLDVEDDAAKMSLKLPSDKDSFV
jgi:predicted secreted acid phosphatase